MVSASSPSRQRILAEPVWPVVREVGRGSPHSPRTSASRKKTRAGTDLPTRRPSLDDALVGGDNDDVHAVSDDADHLRRVAGQGADQRQEEATPGGAGAKTPAEPPQDAATERKRPTGERAAPYAALHPLLTIRAVGDRLLAHDNLNLV